MMPPQVIRSKNSPMSREQGLGCVFHRQPQRMSLCSPLLALVTIIPLLNSALFGAVVILSLGRLLCYSSLECAKMDTG